MKLRCIIVDDEPLARKGMEEYVRDVIYLQHVGSFENAAKATTFLSENPVDLILLDIRMPKVSGIEFLKALNDPPMVIFTTAFSEHALEGYALDVIDYLVKPIPFNRFVKATQKAFDFYSLRQKASTDAIDYFFIKCEHKFEKVNYAELLYVEAMQNYCILHTVKKKLITYITLTAMLEKLPADQFMKVHKSFIVSLSKISALDGSEVIIGSTPIPVSRSLKDEVMNRIMGDNLLRRLLKH
jgi:DNA-binding LytR/AlgR family response regulator